MTLHRDERGVSPVIGVILMLALAVLLAATLGAFVFMQAPGEDPDPNPDVVFDYDRSVEELTVTHNGADPITADNTHRLEFKGDVADSVEADDWNTDVLDPIAGDENEAIVVSEINASTTIATNVTLEPGQDYKLVWVSTTGDFTIELGSDTIY